MHREGHAKAECRNERISLTVAGEVRSFSGMVFTIATATISPDRLNAFSSQPVYVLSRDSMNRFPDLSKRILAGLSAILSRYQDGTKKNRNH
jgi:hypothetical protein